MSYFVLPILNVGLSGLITSVGEERVFFSTIDYSLLCCFYSKAFPHPLEA